MVWRKLILHFCIVLCLKVVTVFRNCRARFSKKMAPTLLIVLHTQMRDKHTDDMSISSSYDRIISAELLRQTHICYAEERMPLNENIYE